MISMHTVTAHDLTRHALLCFYGLFAAMSAEPSLPGRLMNFGTDNPLCSKSEVTFRELSDFPLIELNDCLDGACNSQVAVFFQKKGSVQGTSVLPVNMFLHPGNWF